MQLTLSLQRVVEEEHVMHLKGNIIEYMSYDNANEVADEFFEFFLSRYQIDLETSNETEWFYFQFS